MNPRLRHQGWDFQIDADRLRVVAGDVTVSRLCLAPSIEGEPTSLKPWQQIDRSHFAAELNEGAGTVHIAVEHRQVCYWLETTRDAFAALGYFPASAPTLAAWQTFLSDELDRLWDVNLDVTVPISSCYIQRHPDGRDGAGMLDPCDRPDTWIWNIPVRAAAFANTAGWLGLSIPGPLPVGVTRLSMEKRRFTLTFEVLRPGCREGAMPRVYLVPALGGAYDVLDAHREISRAMGLIATKPGEDPAWWSRPLYKYWDEMCRRHKERFGDFKSIHIDESGREVTDLTTANLLEWTHAVSQSIGTPVNITLEQGAFLRYGEYRPTQSLGGPEGFRRTVDQLRDQDTHTAFFFHQYHVDTGLPIYREHPECFCRPRAEAPELVQGTPAAADEKLAHIDWTHPLGRAYMLDLVEYLVSDKPGCLNVDYLAINNNMGPDPRYFEFHDPDWGIGDLMQYKVQRLIYEHARAIKPECLVRRQSAADCYMQPVADHINCCEDWHSDADHWYRRAQIVTRLMEGVLFGADAWFVTLSKSSDYYMALAVLNVPEIESVHHAIHPYLYHREMREKDYRRRRAGVQVYQNAPARRDHLCRVTVHDRDRIEAWRRYTHGPLEGFYAALALSRRSLVTYNAKQALVACCESRTVDVPLPPGATVGTVEMVPHDGATQAWDHEIVESGDGEAVRMHIEDCGGDCQFYRIAYDLARVSRGAATVE